MLETAGQLLAFFSLSPHSPFCRHQNRVPPLYLKHDMTLNQFPSSLPSLQHVLAIISMCILSLFLLENLLLIVGLGPRKFFTNAFYVIDLIVVTVSLALEVRGGGLYSCNS